MKLELDWLYKSTYLICSKCHNSASKNTGGLLGIDEVINEWNSREQHNISRDNQKSTSENK